MNQSISYYLHQALLFKVFMFPPPILTDSAVTSEWDIDNQEGPLSVCGTNAMFDGSDCFSGRVALTSWDDVATIQSWWSQVLNKMFTATRSNVSQNSGRNLITPLALNCKWMMFFIVPQSRGNHVFLMNYSDSCVLVEKVREVFSQCKVTEFWNWPFDAKSLLFQELDQPQIKSLLNAKLFKQWTNTSSMSIPRKVRPIHLMSRHKQCMFNPTTVTPATSQPLGWCIARVVNGFRALSGPGVGWRYKSPVG